MPKCDNSNQKWKPFVLFFPYLCSSPLVNAYVIVKTVILTQIGLIGAVVLLIRNQMGKNHISNNCVFHLFLAYGQNSKTCYDEPSLNSFPLNFNIPITEESREANNAVTHVRIAYRLFVPCFVVLFLIFVCVGHCLTNFSRERVLGRYSGKILSLILQEGVFILFYFFFAR